ncbi:MAG: multidrug effflux MFS transporter [Bradyrhizobiaceae bacterium]|nr:multidrug effflux MFS transporter [Bradyrhizobiaceae bacterium]
MEARFVRDALILGLLMAIGPFAIDMYLPALPTVGRSLGASPDLVLMTLTAFFLSFGLFQVVVGPVSDIVGPKRPLYFGLVLFAAASVGCALADDIYSLIVWRVVQGIGAAAGTVIPGAIVRDMHTGLKAARLMSLLMLVFSVSPILAPSAGSLLIEVAGWRAVFWFVAAAAVAALVMLAALQRETRPPADRRGATIASSLAAFGLLLRHRDFLALTFVGGFALSSLFIYLGNSSFVLIDHYGLSPTLYAIAFSTNAAAVFGSAQLNGWLGKRFPLWRIVQVATIGHAAAMLLLLVLVASGIDRLEVICVLLFIGYAFLGQIMPIATVLAMDEHGSIAGAAYSLMSTLRLVIGAAAIGISSLFADGTALPMVAAIALSATAAFLLWQFTHGRTRAAVERAPAE